MSISLREEASNWVVRSLYFCRVCMERRGWFGDCVGMAWMGC